MKYDQYSRERQVDYNTVNYSIKLSKGEYKDRELSIRKYVNKKRYLERNQSRQTKYSDTYTESDSDIILGRPVTKNCQVEHNNPINKPYISIQTTRKRKRECDTNIDYYNYEIQKDKDYIDFEFNRRQVILTAKYNTQMSRLKCKWYETHHRLKKYGTIIGWEEFRGWENFM